MFHLSNGHLQGVWLIHLHSTIIKIYAGCEIQFSDQRVFITWLLHENWYRCTYMNKMIFYEVLGLRRYCSMTFWLFVSKVIWIDLASRANLVWEVTNPPSTEVDIRYWRNSHRAVLSSLVSCNLFVFGLFLWRISPISNTDAVGEGWSIILRTISFSPNKNK